MHVIIEHSEIRKKIHIVLLLIKVITRHTVTSHCKRIDNILLSLEDSGRLQVGGISPSKVADMCAVNKITLY